MTPTWSTAVPDWEERIIAGKSLIPFDPLFPAEAKAALDIFDNMRIVDAPGSPTMLEACRPWLREFVSHIFGSYDADTGRRLIRYFFLLVAKKNAKSTGAAEIMVTALLRNWRLSGEFYILAPTKEVADNSFFPARDSISADEKLRTLLHVQENFRTITHRNTGAFLKVVAADSETVSGKKTIGLLVDELWLFGKRANAANMLREAMGGLASRPEGFVIWASTQSDQAPLGVFADRLAEFRDIRDGKIIDPRSLGVLYEFPKKLLPRGKIPERKYWYIPNPNLGASVDEEYLAEQAAKAEREGAVSIAGFLAKHLNVQIDMALRADGWVGGTVWPRGIERGLDLDQILERSEVVTVGVDGGGLDDLLGIAVIGREKVTKRWLAWTHAFISDIGIERRKANIEHYNKFEKAGDLTKFRYAPLLEGAEIAPGQWDVAGAVPVAEHFAASGLDATILTTVSPNIGYVVALAVRCKRLGLLAQVGVDAAGIGAIVDALAAVEITQDEENLDAVRQGIALMGAIKTVEIKLADQTFRHGGQPMMDWCVENAITVPTATAMRIARDASGFGKIDPLMALFNAAHLMSLNPEAPGLSFWEVAA